MEEQGLDHSLAKTKEGKLENVGKLSVEGRRTGEAARLEALRGWRVDTARRRTKEFLPGNGLGLV